MGEIGELAGTVAELIGRGTVGKHVPFPHAMHLTGLVDPTIHTIPD